MTSPTTYLDPTDESVIRLLERRIDGPVTMLNLLRFREWADYSAFPEAAPSEPISGSDAYDRYMDHTMPFLTASGGSVVFLGAGDFSLVGPREERWDLVMAVRQKGVQSFLEFASNPDYMSGVCHRTAALTDSRLYPLLERPTTGRPSAVGE
jgi:hypothetical protein